MHFPRDDFRKWRPWKTHRVKWLSRRTSGKDCSLQKKKGTDARGSTSHCEHCKTGNATKKGMSRIFLAKNLRAVGDPLHTEIQSTRHPLSETRPKASMVSPNASAQHANSGHVSPHEGNKTRSAYSHGQNDGSRVSRVGEGCASRPFFLVPK